MPSTQEIFEELLGMQGKEVEVGIQSLGKTLKGKIVNTMFDSFILESAGKNNIIRFDDISYLEKQAR